ncbi:hypothetical protein D3C79_720960 [compost metagenome]
MLDEHLPVDGRQQAQAANAVADGHLVNGLLLGIELDMALDAARRLAEHLFHPQQRLGQRSAVALQPPGQLGDEGGGHRRLRPGHVGDHQHHALGVALGGFAKPVGPDIGQVAVSPVGHDPRRYTAQVFYQGQAQHDRDGPELAQGQGAGLLISLDETAEALSVDPPVTVGNGLQGNVVDTRQAGGGAVVQLRQLQAVVGRQVVLGNADMGFDQVKVVEQPLRGG